MQKSRNQLGVKRVAVCVALLFSGVASPLQAADAVTSPPLKAAPAIEAPSGETGLAAVYSDVLNGHRTASGQIYQRNKLTAAHKTLAFGTMVKVTNAKNGKSVVVRINDRGPKQADRVLDISPRAARALGINKRGMAEVRLETTN
jgi:rare lipoprotein A